MTTQEQTISPASITVVIPLFNKASDVRRAIASVLVQTCPAAQIIVVDDGSTDSGPEIVRSIADPRIQLVTQSNQGVSAARNHGVALAKSQLIAFLDADDEWMPDHLQTILRLQQTFPQCQVFGTSYLVRVDAATVGRKPIFRGLPREPWEGMIEEYFGIVCKSDPPLWSSAVAVTRTALEAIGGFPVGIVAGEDLLTWARLAMRYKIAYCTKVSAVFWRPSVTFWQSQTWQARDEKDMVGLGLAELLADANPSVRTTLSHYIGLWHKTRGSCCIMANDMAGARREFAKARQHLGWTPKLAIYTLISLLPLNAARQVRCKCELAMRMWHEWCRA